MCAMLQSHLNVASSVVRRTPCVSLVCQQGAECSISSSNVVCPFSNGKAANRVQMSVGTNLAIPLCVHAECPHSASSQNGVQVLSCKSMHPAHNAVPLKILH
jgi:hypothetical protein